MNIYLAGQIYTITSFMLILSGTVALHRQLYGRWSVLPLIAFPLLYNNVFLVGTMNYVFGIGLSIWAIGTWIWLRERSLWLRLLVSTLFVLALFFCHLDRHLHQRAVRSLPHRPIANRRREQARELKPKPAPLVSAPRRLRK